MYKNIFLFFLILFIPALQAAKPYVEIRKKGQLRVSWSRCEIVSNERILRRGKAIKLGSRQKMIPFFINEGAREADYILDESGLLWGPESTHKATQAEAIRICDELNDLGLKWRLPSMKKFLLTGNAQNTDNRGNPYFVRAVPMTQNYYWSASVKRNTHEAYYISRPSSKLWTDSPHTHKYFRCVADSLGIFD